MVTEIEACSREDVNSLPSESNESGTEDTPAKKGGLSIRCFLFVVGVIELVICRIGSQNQ